MKIASLPAQFLAVSDGSRLAYLHLPGCSPGIMFCAGFQSNMRGRKAEALMNWCDSTGREFTCFDYFGHGESLPPPHVSAEDTARHGTVGCWLSDTLAVLDTLTGPSSVQILVGSSMGAWLAILVTRARPARISGFVGLASAPDAFQLVEDVIRNSPILSQSMQNEGFCDVPSSYSNTGYYRLYRELIQEAAAHTLHTTDMHFLAHIPVRLIHGKQDEHVPWQISQRLFDFISSRDKQIVYIEDGDHRLSRDQDLIALIHQLEELTCTRS